MERECQTKREKGTTINGALRLATKCHESAEPINLTCQFNPDRVLLYKQGFFILRISIAESGEYGGMGISLRILYLH